MKTMYMHTLCACTQHDPCPLQPDVVELHQQMTPNMTAIQLAVL